MQPKHAKEQESDTLTSPSLPLAFVRYAFIAYLVCVLMAITFIAPRIQYHAQAQTSGNGPAYIFSALLLGSAIVLVAKKIPMKAWAETPRAFNFTVAGAFVALVLLHLVIITGGWFESGWDVRFVTGEKANTYYFSTYPNNLFLSGLFRYLQRIALRLGMRSKYLPLVVCSGACLTVSMVLITYVARKTLGYKAGYCTLALSFVCIGLTPWMLVPYSDTYAMPFTTAILWAFLCIDDPRVKWGSITLLAAIGYQIKPTVIFACAAVIFVALLDMEGTGRAKRSMKKALDKDLLHRWLFVVAACALSLVLAFSASHFLKKSSPVINPEASFGVAHFLMMGANTATDGMYSSDDVAFSKQFDNRADRNAADFRRWRERLAGMGPYGFIKHWVKKSLINYNDGTFAWKREGNFFTDTHGDNELVKSIYGIDDVHGGQALVVRPVRYASAAHILWLLLLIGCVLSTLGAPKRADFVICAALLMISLFLLVFECRARYLLLYLPYFILLGVTGWSRLSYAIGKCRVRREGNNQ